MEESRSVPQWGLARRILFRFVFVYFLIYLLPFPLDVIPGLEKVIQKYQDLWNALVPWVGEHVFHVGIPAQPAGSGDTTYNYVQIFCYAVLAATVALVWTLLDRRRPSYARLHEGFRIYVRFALATVMLGYGMAKVFKGQFPDPPLDRLLQTYGNSSPMGILWTFMGASTAYTVFSGLCEVVGGLLLTTRRTALLGALVSMGVLANIVMLNFCYDVPVKLYSSHLFLMGLFIAAPDLKRLANLLVLNRRVEPVEPYRLFARPWLHRASLVLRTLLIGSLAGYLLYGAYQARKEYGDLAPRSPLYGVWNVDEFVVDGAVRPPLVTDTVRWRRMVFEYPGFVSIQPMNESSRRVAYMLKLGKNTMTLNKRGDSKGLSTLSYQQPGPGFMALEGTLNGQKIRARLSRQDNSFLLVNRGFHWVNEYPFNR
ncbi:MAG: hypothetical protein QOF89_4462 [Acidobacteriota bacterium]|jgi:hypothetical protein|nr:hypothetical protein [Acidobacteriota bacterium]